MVGHGICERKDNERLCRVERTEPKGSIRCVSCPDSLDITDCDRWYSLVETLAWLHTIEPDDIGLQGYGKKTDFYKRQCQTFSRIEAQQAVVKHWQTGEVLGRAHERYDEVTDYVRKHLPKDRYSIIHGDFKFDNVVS